MTRSIVQFTDYTQHITTIYALQYDTMQIFWDRSHITRKGEECK